MREIPSRRSVRSTNRRHRCQDGNAVTVRWTFGKMGLGRVPRAVPSLLDTSPDPVGLAPAVKEIGQLIEEETRSDRPPRACHVGEEDCAATRAVYASQLI